jgi:aspartyl-tRNA(Asn)/glutamyl-tRNA(Gln) amidotransferase subunit B
LRGYAQSENVAIPKITAAAMFASRSTTKESMNSMLADSPAHVAELVELVAKGDLTDKLARQVVEGVVAGEGTPSEVVAKRGIKVVNDDGALMAAIEKVCAEQAETAEKVRGGHLPAAGALIGAVMKETKGQADAARVRELLLGHLGQPI